MNKLFCDKNVVANISSSTSQMADNNMSSDYINMHHNENSSLPADMMMSTSETNNNDNYDDKTNAVKDNPDMDANDFPVVEKQQHSHQVILSEQVWHAPMKYIQIFFKYFFFAL